MGKYFEDFKIGERFNSPARTLTEADIVTFAGLSGDYNPLHTDEEFAKKTPFKGRVAHGLLTLAISEGLRARLALFEGTAIALLGVNNVRFISPVKAGDTIRVESRVASKRETSKQERGIIILKDVVKNQRNEVVMEAEITIMVRKKYYS
ncbi:MAG: dehydratase [Nitrososphaeria archaeon]|nr:dehydratase [Nitrososphaeria archaeon]NIN52451.1 dehydratase [Nitrososphaeria archaeon]NIQ33590.1 dehydratase [Nitrososphaeria archaeon]